MAPDKGTEKDENMTDDELIEAPFARGVEAQKNIDALTIPEGTNPTGLQKFAICLPFVCAMFAPLLVFDITNGNQFVSGFVFGLCAIAFTGGIFWLAKKAAAQQKAIAARDKAHLHNACSLAKQELTRA